MGNPSYHLSHLREVVHVTKQGNNIYRYIPNGNYFKIKKDGTATKLYEVQCECGNLRFHPSLTQADKYRDIQCVSCKREGIRHRYNLARHRVFAKLYGRVTGFLDKSISGTSITLPGTAFDLDIIRLCHFVPQTTKLIGYESYDAELAAKLKLEMKSYGTVLGEADRFSVEEIDIFEADKLDDLIFANFDAETPLTEKLSRRLLLFMLRNVSDKRFAFLLNTTARCYIRGHDKEAKDKVWNGLLRSLQSYGFNIVENTGRTQYVGSSTMYLYGGVIERN